MTGTRSLGSNWVLRHAWQGRADRAALAVCKDALAQAGIELVDADVTARPDAVKMHSMELRAAIVGDSVPMDLQRVANAAQWDKALPSFAQQYMRQGTGWHGIPIGIHRANLMWANRGLVRQAGHELPESIDDLLVLLRILQRWVKTPLALGDEAWQIGLCFESIVLSVAGPDCYRRAFVHCYADVWSQAKVIAALDRLMRLRDFVGADSLASPWMENLERVQRGESAVLFMADWVRACNSEGLLELPVPGTGDNFVAIVDYFVPIAGDRPEISERAAWALTGAEFQLRFAQRKGCMPTLCMLWPAIDFNRARLLTSGPAVLPSLTFDQSCAVDIKQSILDIVADSFLHERGVEQCALRLAESCGHRGRRQEFFA